MKTIEEIADIGALAAYSGRGQQEYNISINPSSQFWEKDRPARAAFAAAVRDAVLSDNEWADKAKDLEDRNERQYQSFKEIANLLGIAGRDEDVSSISSAIERLQETVAQLREHLTEAEDELAAAAADVPTWRPIAELPENIDRYAFTNGVTCWGTSPLGASHFIAPPLNPDPFEAWWEASGYVAEKGMARQAWDAAREAKA